MKESFSRYSKPSLSHVSVEDKKEKTLQRILTSHTKVRSEISDLKEKLHLAKETISKFKDEIAKLQNSGSTSMMTGL